MQPRQERGTARADHVSKFQVLRANDLLPNGIGEEARFYDSPSGGSTTGSRTVYADSAVTAGHDRDRSYTFLFAAFFNDHSDKRVESIASSSERSSREAGRSQGVP